MITIAKQLHLLTYKNTRNEPATSYRKCSTFEFCFSVLLLYFSMGACAIYDYRRPHGVYLFAGWDLDVKESTSYMTSETFFAFRNQLNFPVSWPRCKDLSRTISVKKYNNRSIGDVCISGGIYLRRRTFPDTWRSI